jgi:hypothetical protein
VEKMNTKTYNYYTDIATTRRQPAMEVLQVFMTRTIPLRSRMR